MDADYFCLRRLYCKEPFGEVTWKGMNLTKTYVGQRIYDIDPDPFCVFA